MRSGLPHEINVHRGQAVGLVGEVAKRDLPGQSFGSEGAGGLNVADLFLAPSA
jgi:hypothetical protein